MTELFSPSIPMQIAPERFTFALSSRMMFALGFFFFALNAAKGPAVPPPIIRMSQSICSIPSSISSIMGSDFLCLGYGAARYGICQVLVMVVRKLAQISEGVDRPVVTIGKGDVHPGCTDGRQRGDGDVVVHTQCTEIDPLADGDRVAGFAAKQGRAEMRRLAVRPVDDQGAAIRRGGHGSYHCGLRNWDVCATTVPRSD